MRIPHGALQSTKNLTVGSTVWLFEEAYRLQAAKVVGIEPGCNNFEVQLSVRGSLVSYTVEAALWNMGCESSTYPDDFVFINYWHAYAHWLQVRREK